MPLESHRVTITSLNPMYHPHHYLATRSKAHHLHPPCCDTSRSSLLQCITPSSLRQHVEEEKHTHTATLIGFTIAPGQGKDTGRRDKETWVLSHGHNNTTKTATGGHAPDGDDDYFGLFNEFTFYFSRVM